MKHIPSQCVACPNLLSGGANADPLCCRYMLPAPAAVGKCAISGKATVAANTEKLVTLIESSGVSEESVTRRLEEMVRTEKIKEAFAINKEGIAAQVAFLFASKTSSSTAKKTIHELIEKVKTEEPDSVLPGKAPGKELFQSKPDSDEDEHKKKQQQLVRRYRG